MKKLVLLFVTVFAAATAFGHGVSDVSSAAIALDEKLGHSLPGDLTFYDENGSRLVLRKHLDKPTIIAPVYLSCTHTCPLLLTGLASALGKVEFVRPGKDFQVLTVSFDEKDTPRVAQEKKQNYLAAAGKTFPETAWKFAVGDPKNIREFTRAVGFTIQRDGEEFSHPVALVVVSPAGKIVRYLYGTDFLPFDVTMAVNEAAEGKVGSTANRVLTYCFSYDPLKKSYVFNILKVAGTVTAFGVVGLFAYLVVSTRKRRRTG